MKRTAVSVIVTLMLLGVFRLFAVNAAPALSPARLVEFARRLSPSLDPYTSRSTGTLAPTIVVDDGARDVDRVQNGAVELQLSTNPVFVTVSS